MGETTDRTSLIALAERCERAEGRDEAIDIQIAYAGGRTRQQEVHPTTGSAVARWRAPNGEPPGWSWEPPAYTDSVDAVRALIAETLPGWQWVLHSPRKGLSFGASLSDPSPGGAVIVSETKPASAPLALLAAALRALASEAERMASLRQQARERNAKALTVAEDYGITVHPRVATLRALASIEEGGRDGR